MSKRGNVSWHAARYRNPVPIVPVSVSAAWKSLSTHGSKLFRRYEEKALEFVGVSRLAGRLGLRSAQFQQLALLIKAS